MSTLPTPSRRRFLGASVLVAGATMAAAPAVAARPRPARADLALTHATVIDTARGGALPDRTVLVRDERIVALGRTAEVPTDGMRVLDVGGRFVIPGLTDMHVHTSYRDIDFPLHIAHGVTTVREMWGHPWTHDWAADADAGRVVGPRLHIASQLIDGDPSLWSSFFRPAAPLTPRTADEARRAVRQEIAGGAAFIKVYSRVTRPILAAVIDEAQRHDVRVVGHCPDGVPMQDAARMGMYTFEHLDGVWWSTAHDEQRFRRALDGIVIDPQDSYDSWWRQIGALEWPAATSYDRRHARRLFAVLRGTGSWQVPTLVLNRRIDIPDGSGDPRLAYVPDDDAALWTTIAAGIDATRTPAQRQQHRVLFELRKQLVGAMAAAGVPLLAGTDTGTQYQYAGSSLHDELELLVESGLRPRHALRAATVDAARALGTDADAGTVEVDKWADLVVLDADPRRDIRAVRGIHAVLARGRLFTAADRARLLDAARRAAHPPQGSPAPARLAPACACSAAHHAR